MPLYEYECESCGRRFERIQKFSDPPVTECPHCSGAVRKLLSSPAIQFKGSGFYITDYPKSGSGSDSKKTADGAKSASGDTGDAKSAPANTEAKAGDSSTTSEPAKAEPKKTSGSTD
jgi:putative FmdB family regulatory protein